MFHTYVELSGGTNYGDRIRSGGPYIVAVDEDHLWKGGPNMAASTGPGGPVMTDTYVWSKTSYGWDKMFCDRLLFGQPFLWLSQPHKTS